MLCQQQALALPLVWHPSFALPATQIEPLCSNPLCRVQTRTRIIRATRGIVIRTIIIATMGEWKERKRTCKLLYCFFVVIEFLCRSECQIEARGPQSDAAAGSFLGHSAGSSPKPPHPQPKQDEPLISLLLAARQTSLRELLNNPQQLECANSSLEPFTREER